MQNSKIEAKELAHSIYNIQQADWKTKRQWHREGKSSWKLSDRIRMTKSDDCMSLYLLKTYDDQAREFCKVIPAFNLDENCIEKLLCDQPWCCI